MQINILDVQFQNILFIAFLVSAVVFTLIRDSNPYDIDITHTKELKGIAILMVLFSHIGYFLSTDPRFTYPLSVGGGIGVNLFLFLSGFGLTRSAMKTPKSIKQFYMEKLLSIFLPMWLFLTMVVFLDAIFLHRNYDAVYIIQSFLGFFPNADISSALNSPLWYFTLIFFYYLTFPVIYKNRFAVFSVLAFIGLGYYLTTLKLPVTADVLKLYELHYLAFPLGILFAHLYTWKKLVEIRLFTFSSIVRCLLIALFVYVFCYTAINSHVGDMIRMNEQLTSLVSVFSLIIVFYLKDFQSNFLLVLGKYSYEIYLIQWPILYRYDFLYTKMPVFLATLLYILLFILIGAVSNTLVKAVISRVRVLYC